MDRRWMIFTVGALNFLFSQFYRTTNAVLAPYLVRDLHLDSEGLGLLSATFFYVFALSQIPILLFIDKIGPRRFMTFLSISGVVGAITFALAHDLTMAILGRALLGIGMSCAFVGSLKLLAVWFPPVIFATVTGLLSTIGTLGNIISTTPLAIMAEELGWREGFLILALFHALLTVAIWFIVRDRPEEESAQGISSRGNPFRNLILLMKKRDYWVISGAAFLRYGTFASLQALWVGPLLMMVLKYSPVATGNIILAMNLGIIAGFPVWGFLSDKVFRARKRLIICGALLLSITTLMLTRLTTETEVWVTGTAFFCLGFFTSSGQLMYTHIKELFPPTMAGAAITGMNFFNMLGPACFLQLLGLMMNVFYPGASFSDAAFKMAIYFCVACQLLAGILYLMTRESKA